MRSNPLDIKGEPNGLATLGVAGAAAIAFGVGGLFVDARATDQRTENVRAEVLAQGFGKPTVKPIRGDECWRGREGFTWETARARGSACAGPGSQVTLFPGLDRPHL